VGVRCLQALLESGVHVPLLFSHEDDPLESRWYGSVVELARSHRVPVVTPEDPNTESWAKVVTDLRPDFVFAFYYRHMLGEPLLSSAARGALNMHGSLLPKYRGRAPVNWAIIRGERETGATLHYMVAKPDAGPVVGRQAVPIAINDTALDVSLKVAAAAGSLLRRSVPELIAGCAAAEALDLSAGSYFGRRRPQDGAIDWRETALSVHNLIRGVAPPFPGAFSALQGRKMRVLGSRFHDQPGVHADMSPCLYVEGARFYVDCIDNSRIELTGIEIDGAELSPSQFAAMFGARPVQLI